MIVGDHHERLEGVELGALVLGKIAAHSLQKIERQPRCRVLFAQNFAGERHLELGGIGAGDCGAMMIDPVNLRAPLAQFGQMRAGRR